MGNRVLDRLPMERAELVVIKAQVVSRAGSPKEAVLIRFEKSITRELLTNWGIWKELLTTWDAWKPHHTEVGYLIDNGMGYKGGCPVHGYEHVQIVPLGKEAMRCFEAMKMVGGVPNARTV